MIDPVIAQERLLARQRFIDRLVELAMTVEEQIATVRQFCATITALSQAIVALGGYTPDNPMAIIDALLTSSTTCV